MSRKNLSCRDRGLPHCRNKIADWLYVQLIKTMRYGIKGIYLVRNMRDPDYKKPIILYGLFWNNIVYLNYDVSKKEKISTLIHELAHATWPDATEKEIWAIESLLFKTFSKRQKDILWLRIASASVKKLPREKKPD